MSGIGSLQWLGSNTSPPIQAAVSLAQGDTLSVETFDVVQALLREARHEPERGIHIPKVNLDDAIVLTFIDGS